MTLSEELQWRGFVNQTTFKNIEAIDGDPISFYFGVDPSAPSMTIGNLAAAMMVRHFIDHGHKAVLLLGGATGLIGDPDGKAEERTLKTAEEVAANNAGIAAQYRHIFAGKDFTIVDNYDWFKGMNYLEFLRDVGKHVPMRQMLGRDFVQSRLGEEGAGISYAEFSYVLIQGYDFLHLNREYGVTLQVCGSDQWGNSIAGVDLIRRITGNEAHVWSTPLVINKATGKKFGKSEDGAVWLDPAMTSPTQFYQFWINSDDEGVEEYMKIYTLLNKPELDAIMAQHRESPRDRFAQKRLAQEATTLVHGEEQMRIAEAVTEYLTGRTAIGEANGEVLAAIRREIPSVSAKAGDDLLEVITATQLAPSKSEARRLLQGNAIALNGVKTSKELLENADFQQGKILLRKGKAFKDSALIELA
ncbi:MAG TPA: tyrosine--tRNA ligase [Candidatus Saccharimonadales bacterium]|nr:tyrosine--tRNA ligase [Candidatus Saccharimonadales bacterium]